MFDCGGVGLMNLSLLLLLERTKREEREEVNRRIREKREENGESRGGRKRREGFRRENSKSFWERREIAEEGRRGNLDPWVGSYLTHFVSPTH